jgi:hypothetical protein
MGGKIFIVVHGFRSFSPSRWGECDGAKQLTPRQWEHVPKTLYIMAARKQKKIQGGTRARYALQKTHL